MDRPWVVTVGYVMYHVRAFLKHLQENILPILAIYDDVSILPSLYRGTEVRSKTHTV